MDASPLMSEKTTEENGANGHHQSFFITECVEEEKTEHLKDLREQNHQQNPVNVKPCPKTIKTPRRRLKWILLSIFLILVLVSAAVVIGIIWPKLVNIVFESENEQSTRLTASVTTTNSPPIFEAIIQCTGDKIRNPEYPSHPDQCICPGDTEEKKENGTECSCPYGSIADPDDSTICIDLPDECLDYVELNDRKRSHRWKTQPAQDWCDNENNHLRKSPEWNGKNWYRFVGEAGTQMPENQVEMEHCGTQYSGWLNGTHPQNRKELSRRIVCFSHPSNNCYMKTRIRIRNCINYFVYELPNVRSCNKGNAGYCAQ